MRTRKNNIRTAIYDCTARAGARETGRDETRDGFLAWDPGRRAIISVSRREKLGHRPARVPVHPTTNISPLLATVRRSSDTIVLRASRIRGGGVWRVGFYPARPAYLFRKYSQLYGGGVRGVLVKTRRSSARRRRRRRRRRVYALDVPFPRRP